MVGLDVKQILNNLLGAQKVYLMFADEADQDALEKQFLGPVDNHRDAMRVAARFQQAA